MVRILVALSLLCLKTVATPPPALDSATLKKLIQDHNLRSVPAVLKHLHTHFGVEEFLKKPGSAEERKLLDIFQGVVPVEGSGSDTHAASKTHPRLLAVNQTGTLFLAIDATEGSPGRLHLQLIELKDRYDNHGSRRRYWDFQEIIFSEDGTQPPRFLDGQKGHEPKPKSCVGCHHGRPLVETYAFWPRWFSAYETPTAREKKLLTDFLTAQATHPVYKYVVPLLQQAAEFQGVSGNIEDFATKASKSNFLTIADTLRATPNYDAYKYALLGALLACPKPESFIPESLKKGKRSAEKVFEDTKKKNLAHYEENVKAAVEGAGPLLDKANQDGMTLFHTSGVRYVVEEIMGVSMKHWPMTGRKASYAFADGGGGLFSLVGILGKDVALTEIETTTHVKKIFDVLEEKITEKPKEAPVTFLTELDIETLRPTCQSLATKSLAALEKLAPPAPPPPSPAKPAGKIPEHDGQ